MRFIALHIIKVKIKPEAPTRQPETTSTVLLIAKPAKAAAKPESAFKNEMITGMSPPPIGITIVKPKRRKIAVQAITPHFSISANPNGFSAVKNE